MFLVDPCQEKGWFLAPGNHAQLPDYFIMNHAKQLLVS